MDPQTLQMMAQALMTNGAQPGPMPMQSGYGGMYGMPSTQGGGMLGSSPYQSINPNAMPQGGNGMGGYPGGANPNQLQQPYQQFPDTGNAGGLSGGTSNGQ